MLGNPNAILQACALPAEYAPQFDHTYVEAPTAGLRWGCFGRDAGGARVVAGSGNVSQADCLSHRRWPSDPVMGAFLIYAGIIYGVTGVCHQASNRILYPAGVTLPSHINGYAKSLWLYDEYGLRTWTEFPSCMGATTSGPANQTLTLTDHTRFRSDDFMTSTATDAPQPPRKAIDEMRAFVKSQLGHPLPDGQVRELQAAKAAFRERQAKLIDLLLQDEITKEIYLRELQSLAEHYMGANRSLLGDEDFLALFGETGLNPLDIVDKKLFLAGSRS